MTKLHIQATGFLECAAQADGIGAVAGGLAQFGVVLATKTVADRDTHDVAGAPRLSDPPAGLGHPEATALPWTR